MEVAHKQKLDNSADNVVNNCTSKTQTIDFNKLIQDYQVSDKVNFKAYLFFVFKDLAYRSGKEENKGISQIVFLQYYNLPGLIGDRVFTLFDKNEDGYLDLYEFINGMLSIFNKGYTTLVKTIFNFYDFDNDGRLSPEDIRIVLSFISLTHSQKEPQIKDFKFEKQRFQARLDSQEEIRKLTNKMFKDVETIDEEEFGTLIKTGICEAFIYLLVFLMTHKPFSKTTIKECIARSITYPKVKGLTKKNESSISKLNSSGLNPQIDLNNSNALPNLSPCETIKKFSEEGLLKYPVFKSYVTQKENLENNFKYVAEDIKACGSVLNSSHVSHMSVYENINTLKMSFEKSDKIPLRRRLTGGVNKEQVDENANVSNISKDGEYCDLNYLSSDNTLGLFKSYKFYGNQVHEKSDESALDSSNLEDDEDYSCEEEEKQTIPSKDKKDKYQLVEESKGVNEVDEKLYQTFLLNGRKRLNCYYPTLELGKDHQIKTKSLTSKINVQNVKNFITPAISTLSRVQFEDIQQSNLCIAGKTELDLNSSELFKSTPFDSFYEEKENVVRFQGYLIKVTKTKKIKTRWYKLINKDLVYYIDKGDKTYESLHILTNAYVKEEKKVFINNKNCFVFSIAFQHKKRLYHCESEVEYLEWIRKIKQVTGFEDLRDLYKLGNELGSGGYGMVLSCVNLNSSREAAIKIIEKENVTPERMIRMRNEIEILKQCQHPHIIKLFDVLENDKFIYIIMEICKGGNLFQWMEDRNFQVNERTAVKLIHQLATSIFYLQSFGIVHRDIKPENILMTESSDQACIKLTDFGLSRITSPNEVLYDAVGTLGFTAPEVLLGNPHDCRVDIWGLGIISYFLITGFLPISSRDSKEIFTLTTKCPIYYPKEYWSGKSADSKNFVKSMLHKNQKKRASIVEILTHPFILKYTDREIVENRMEGDLMYFLYSSK